MLRDVGSAATSNDSLSFSDREIAGGNSVVADQTAVYAARALIPENASYHVAVSPDYAGGSELTRDHVAGYYRYFLMPRRPAERAGWVVCYGCDLSAYGEVIHRDSDLVTLRVPKIETARVTARLLAEQDVLDLNVEDPPIEDVIELVFAREAPE